MNQFQILVNSKPIQLGEPIPTKVEYLNIIHTFHPLFPLEIHPTEVPMVKQWFNTLADALDLSDGYLTINNTCVKQSDVTKFKL